MPGLEFNMQALRPLPLWAQSTRTARQRAYLVFWVGFVKHAARGLSTPGVEPSCASVFWAWKKNVQPLAAKTAGLLGDSDCIQQQGFPRPARV